VRVSTKASSFRGDRLKGLRDAKGLSQEQLEARSGISHTMITRYENGKARPSGDSVDRLAVALDATTDYLYGREFAENDPAAKNPKIAAARMAFDAFYKDKDVPAKEISFEERDRCRRALSHLEAPKTAMAWRVLCEQVRLICGPPGEGSRQFDVIRGKRRK
jgi:transcriptional regulator with XRE-family HTH domain